MPPFLAGAVHPHPNLTESCAPPPFTAHDTASAAPPAGQRLVSIAAGRGRQLSGGTQIFRRGRPWPSVVRRHPDIPLVHEPDLLRCHFATIFIMPVRDPAEVDILRVDRLFVNELVLLSGEILDPVVPLRVRAELPQRLDVDSPGDPGGSAAVVMSSDDLPAVVDHGRSATESIDRDRG